MSVGGREGGEGEGAHVPTLTSKVSSPPLTSLTHHKTNFVAHNPQRGDLKGVPG